jgi:AcrR family transcriptional regulator
MLYVVTKTKDSEAIINATADLRDALTSFRNTVKGTIGESSGVVSSELSAVTTALTQELLGITEAIGSVAGTKQPTARRIKAEKTRTDLLRAAGEVFAAKGIEGASVNDIAKAAGYTKGALYAHFPSKEELLFALIEVLNIEGTNEIADAARGEADIPAITGGAEALEQILLSLEIYLFALRHPEHKYRLLPTALGSIAGLAAMAHRIRTGETGEPTEEDFDNALVMSACSAFGTVFANLIPADELDVEASIGRALDRLFP